MLDETDMRARNADLLTILNDKGYRHAMLLSLDSFRFRQVAQRRRDNAALKDVDSDKEKAPATFVTGASLLGPWQ